MSTDTETKQPEPGTGHEGQTFLVGDEIYLRTVEKDDSKVGMSWRNTRFPFAPEQTETWIAEDLAKEQDVHTLAIVRKSDDRVVGSLRIGESGPHHWFEAKVDPLYGDRGQRWKGLAIALAGEWLTNERGQAIAKIDIPADESITIAEIERGGFVQTARFREMLQRNGQRVDQLVYELYSPFWVKVLGDPRKAPLERAGSGDSRPVPPPVARDVDPPANAVMVGKRVYLRPEDPKTDPAVDARQARYETETFFDIGRHLISDTRMKHWITDFEKGEHPKWINFAVCLKETGERIGVVNLIEIDWQHKFAETGSFLVHPDYRGGGYGSEAKQLLLEYAFERVGLHMLQSWVYFPNTRSAAALRKQGYREAGRIHWAFPHNGTLDNFVVFDLLAEEWRAMPRKEWSAS